MVHPIVRRPALRGPGKGLRGLGMAGQLSDFQVGESVLVQEREDGFVAAVWCSGERAFEAKILAASLSCALLGWTKGQPRIRGAWGRDTPLFLERFNPYGLFAGVVPDQEFDAFSCIVWSAECQKPIRIAAPSKQKGCVCRRCRAMNEWAIPNRPDGSYLCFECRP